MNHQTETIASLAIALSKAQGKFLHATKDACNGQFRNSYATLASCISAAKEGLAENELAVIQTVSVDHDDTYLVTTLVHKSGEWIKSAYPIRPVKQDPQGMGSAITYARRYAFCAIVGIAPDDDDDGNAASGRGANHAPANNTPPPLPNYSAEAFRNNAPKWREVVLTGKKTAAELIGFISSRAVLTDKQKLEIETWELEKE
jgi:hypothetical protein